jgi:hypothetical protein
MTHFVSEYTFADFVYVQLTRVFGAAENFGVPVVQYSIQQITDQKSFPNKCFGALILSFYCIQPNHGIEQKNKVGF